MELDADAARRLLAEATEGAVVIPETFSSVGYGAFRGMKELTSVTMGPCPDSSSAR